MTTRKGTSLSTKPISSVENDVTSPNLGELNSSASSTTKSTKTMMMALLQETVSKQGEDLRALAMENGTLRVLVVKNDSP